MGERVPGGAVPVVWRDRARGNRPRHGRVSRCDTSAACLAGHRAASDAGAILTAVLPQLHVYPALDDRVPAHHDFCLTARRMAQFRRTVIFYPICILAIWLPRLPRRGGERDAGRSSDRAEGAPRSPSGPCDDAGGYAAALRRQASGDDVVPIMLERYAPLWLADCSVPASWRR